MHGEGLFESLVLKNTKRQLVLNECPTMTLTDIYVILVTHQRCKNHVVQRHVLMCSWMSHSIAHCHDLSTGFYNQSSAILRLKVPHGMLCACKAWGYLTNFIVENATVFVGGMQHPRNKAAIYQLVLCSP